MINCSHFIVEYGTGRGIEGSSCISAPYRVFLSTRDEIANVIQQIFLATEFTAPVSTSAFTFKSIEALKRSFYGSADISLAMKHIQTYKKLLF